MSVAEAAHRSASRGAAVRLWLALLVLIAAGIGLAWLGAGQMRAEVTSSGLVFRTIQAGSGPTVQPDDGVFIEYEGRLPDGTVFDSSEGRGPAAMIAGQVIPGFAEALTKMQAGGRYVIRIPSQLAYGAEPPAGSPIPPNADLEFDVHVVQVVPNAALMGAPTQEGGQAPQADAEHPQSEPGQP